YQFDALPTRFVDLIATLHFLNQLSPSGVLQHSIYPAAPRKHLVPGADATSHGHDQHPFSPSGVVLRRRTMHRIAPALLFVLLLSAAVLRAFSQIDPDPNSPAPVLVARPGSLRVKAVREGYHKRNR